MVAREPALEAVTNRELRSFLAYNKSFECTDARIGDVALSYEAANRKMAPRWGAPAKVSDIDETGVTVKFQFQTLKVACYCVRERAEGEERGGRGTDPDVD